MLLKNFAGKPYAGKPHVRIDEGEGSCNLIAPALYSTEYLCYPLQLKFLARLCMVTYLAIFIYTIKYEVFSFFLFSLFGCAPCARNLDTHVILIKYFSLPFMIKIRKNSSTIHTSSIPKNDRKRNN